MVIFFSIQLFSMTENNKYSTTLKKICAKIFKNSEKIAAPINTIFTTTLYYYFLEKTDIEQTKKEELFNSIADLYFKEGCYLLAMLFYAKSNNKSKMEKALNEIKTQKTFINKYKSEIQIDYESITTEDFWHYCNHLCLPPTHPDPWSFDEFGYLSCIDFLKNIKTPEAQKKIEELNRRFNLNFNR